MRGLHFTFYIFFFSRKNCADIKLIGLEQYQININKDDVFQQTIITNDCDKLSGKHFIVGGGIEKMDV